MAKIVIIGGGFGGVYVAKGLARTQYDITLIAETDSFVFSPLLHEVASGVLDPKAIQVPLKTLLPKRYHFHKAKVTAITFKQKTVTAGKKIPYDILVLAPGARAKAKGSTLKTLDDALAIRHMMTKLPKKAHIGIVGGGPTGVELIGELAKRHQCTLFQGSDVILPAASASFRKRVEQILAQKGVHIMTNARINHNGKGYVQLDGGHKVDLDYLIWCIGVQPTRIKTDKDIYNEKNAIIVDKYLHVNSMDNVYALGDAAATSAPMLAQAAEQQAACVVKSIRGKPTAFSFVNRGFLLSVGQHMGVGQVGPFVFTGFSAWWLKRTVYLFKIVDLLPKCRLAAEYTKKLLVPQQSL
ncbi:FAD-dependent oxidoreductase [Candidatus Woesearchaeota archaeon]|nr:FAD-dependent oxidoreductase [Candidatus Woesearchaeota archaeon]